VIPPILGWRMDLLPNGAAFTHPDGSQVGTIHYRSRARPVQRIGGLVRHILAHTPGFTADSISAPERLLTLDGEHAGLVTVTGRQNDVPAQRDLGFVFADDWFSSVGGLCLADELRPRFTALVRELTTLDVHVLGVRRRRFEYQPPPGWQPLAHDLVTEWLPPDYPSNLTTLTVFAANPTDLVQTPTQEVIVAGLERAGYRVERSAQTTLTTDSGLPGTRHVVELTKARRVFRDMVQLRDDRYVYPLELNSADERRWPAHQDIFAQLVRSIRPVPPPSRKEMTAVLMSHWEG
jgi:hypothetical protein